MNEEESLHLVKGLPLFWVNSTKNFHDDNEQDVHGKGSNTHVHINDTAEMTRMPEITTEELQTAINKPQTATESEPKTSKFANDETKEMFGRK